ncbi:hypothetical protein AO375_0637 [Moraxella catarrhalis]|nr:hypothetical protein AO375_0637 [Moraxella catarrhalis]OAV37123.1 hypothetical protein AO365_0536 [Moraxella catarrhalis]
MVNKPLDIQGLCVLAPKSTALSEISTKFYVQYYFIIIHS